MRVTRLSLRDFRNYERAELALDDGLTVVCGPNGAGKTNLLEGLYFGLTGRSCRTSNEREVVRAGARVARVEVATEGEYGPHLLEVGFEPGAPKRLRVDGAPVDGAPDARVRPLAAVFLPERLELVKGPPSARRAHLDRVVAALWPARAQTRAAYGRALAQRNAALARVRAGGDAELLDPWDAELARHGAQLMADRAAAAELLAAPFAARTAELGLADATALRYAPRSGAAHAEELRAELEERRASDLERGFTGHGPHRDDLALDQGGRSLRAYGSQGQQRVALLGLLFAERDVLLERGTPPLMLLDDVMSELDAERRDRLAELLGSGGQSLVTTTDADHVPGARDPDAALVTVADGAIASRPSEPAAAAL